MKDGVHVVNSNEYLSVGTHKLVFHFDQDSAIYFDSFGVEYLPIEIEFYGGEFMIVVRAQLLQIFFRLLTYD